MKIISKSDFQEFVNNLIKDDSYNVIGVKSRANKFAFLPLQTAEELRLDYDVTLLPPKKYFFPQRETLFTYDLAGGFSAKKPEEAKPANLCVRFLNLENFPSISLVGMYDYDSFWKTRDPRPFLKNVTPAVMTVGGWFDAEDLYGALNAYEAIEKQNPPETRNYLVMGPWSHGQWAFGEG